MKMMFWHLKLDFKLKVYKYFWTATSTFKVFMDNMDFNNSLRIQWKNDKIHRKNILINKWVYWITDQFTMPEPDTYNLPPF